MTAPAQSDPADPRPPPPWLYRTLMRVEAPLTGLVGLTCRDFARLTVTRLDRPLTSGEALRHRMHGVMCTLCRGFSAQFNQINILLREAAEETAARPASGTPSDSAVERIQIEVKTRLGPKS